MANESNGSMWERRVLHWRNASNVEWRYAGTFVVGTRRRFCMVLFGLKITSFTIWILRTTIGSCSVSTLTNTMELLDLFD